jgi:predicted nucleotidyltransferase
MEASGLHVRGDCTVRSMAGPEQRRALRVAEDVAAACSALLGDRLVTVVVHGSLALDSFAPGRSDVDVLAVVETPLGDDEIAAFPALVARIEPSVRIDLRVVTRAVAASPTPAPPLELYVGLHPPAEPEIETRVAGERDLAVELSIVRAAGRALVGAEPRDVVGAVPSEWVVAYGDEVMSRWQELTDDAENGELMVLTTCRIWRFASEGVHCSKAEAGRWALARDPSLAAVESALRQRAGEPGVHVDPADIAHLLALVRGEIANRR